MTALWMILVGSHVTIYLGNARTRLRLFGPNLNCSATMMGLLIGNLHRRRSTWRSRVKVRQGLREILWQRNNFKSGVTHLTGELMWRIWSQLRLISQFKLRIRLLGKRLMKRLGLPSWMRRNKHLSSNRSRRSKRSQMHRQQATSALTNGLSSTNSVTTPSPPTNSLSETTTIHTTTKPEWNSQTAFTLPNPSTTSASHTPAVTLAWKSPRACVTKATTRHQKPSYGLFALISIPWTRAIQSHSNSIGNAMIK